MGGWVFRNMGVPLTGCGLWREHVHGVAEKFCRVAEMATDCFISAFLMQSVMKEH